MFLRKLFRFDSLCAIKNEWIHFNGLMEIVDVLTYWYLVKFDLLLLSIRPFHLRFEFFRVFREKKKSRPKSKCRNIIKTISCPFSTNKENNGKNERLGIKEQLLRLTNKSENNDSLLICKNTTWMWLPFTFLYSESAQSLHPLFDLPTR